MFIGVLVYSEAGYALRPPSHFNGVTKEFIKLQNGTETVLNNIEKALSKEEVDNFYEELLSINPASFSNSDYADILYMNMILILAEREQKQGNVPIVATVVNSETGEIIIGERSLYEDKKFGDISLYEHAEIDALKKAVNKGWDMSNTVVYVTVESCLYCALAIVNNFRPSRIVFATIDTFRLLQGRGFEIVKEGGISISSVSSGIIQQRASTLIDLYSSSLSSDMKSFREPDSQYFKDKELLEDVEILLIIIDVIISADKFKIDTPKILTLLLYYFIKINNLLPNEEYPQIIAIDTNHMSLDFLSENFYNNTLVEVAGAKSRINSKDDRFKVILLGEDENIKMHYQALIDSGLVDLNKVYIFKRGQLISYSNSSLSVIKKDALSRKSQTDL